MGTISWYVSVVLCNFSLSFFFYFFLRPLAGRLRTGTHGQVARASRLMITQAIPCDDAMSFPGMAAEYEGRIASDCNGTFFRHHTLNKEKTKDSVATSVMQLLYGMMQDAIRENKDEVWVVEGKRDVENEGGEKEGADGVR